MTALAQVLAVTLASTFLIVGCGGSSGKIKQLVEDNIIESQEKEIRAAVESVMTEFQLPGVSLALVADHRVVYSKGFGTTKLTLGNAVTADTSFWLGSVSKAVTGVALMRAQEQGLLTLDDHVQTLLANDSRVRLSPPHTYPLLLRHLVTHTSTIVDSEAYECAYFVGEATGEHYSLANALIDGNCDESAPADLAGFLNSYLSESGTYYSSSDNFLTTEPGSLFKYSNIASALAGYTIESASGTTLANFANKHIFTPLGMNNTSWTRSELADNNIATPHAWDDESGVMAELPVYELSTWPDGGLRSSANDLGNLLLSIMEQGELPASGGQQEAVRVLEKASVATLLEPMIDSGQDEELSVGVFWMTTKTRGGRSVIGHSGSDPGAYSYMFFDPKKNVGLVLMGNGDDEIAEGFDEAHDALIEELLDAADVLGKI